MASFAKHMILCHANLSTTDNHHRQLQHHNIIHSWHRRHQEEEDRDEKKPQSQPQPQSTLLLLRRRSSILSTLTVLGATAMLEARRPVQRAQAAAEQSWGTRSFIKEKYFQPQLSPDEAVARIRQTAEGLRDMRPMLDTMSWRYVMFYIRLKSAYLDSDLKNAMATLPESRRKSYIKTANEVVDNMSEVIHTLQFLCCSPLN